MPAAQRLIGAGVAQFVAHPERLASAARSSGATMEMKAMAEREAPEESERGQRASFDPKTGEVHGSGSGAGGGGNPDEDYDSDPMAGAGRDLPGGPRPADEAADRAIDPDEGI